MLLEKERAGAGYAVTQIFFDDEAFLRFVKACRDRGVTIPIIPGLKIITRKEHLRVVPSTFGVDIPRALADEIEAADPGDVPEIGIRWAREQVLRLLEGGVPSLHFYVMQNTRPFVRLMESLGPVL